MTAENENKIDTEQPESLFKDVKYYLVGNISNEVIDLLDRGGAERHTYLSQLVTHVIADDKEHDEYQEATELFELPTVTSNWVILSSKVKKLLPIELFSLENRVFCGVKACLSQIGEEDVKPLWGMLVYNGGQCQATLDQTCTHLISSETEGPKYEAALKHEDKVKVVTPDWIADSVEKGEKQDEAVYHPRLIVYPKTPSPPKEPTPPPEPMETAVSPNTQEMQLLQVPCQVTERRGSNDSNKSGSRPTTPSAKEALARMVSNRLQKTPSHSPKSPVSAQCPPFPASLAPPLHHTSLPSSMGVFLPPQEDGEVELPVPPQMLPQEAAQQHVQTMLQAHHQAQHKQQQMAHPQPQKQPQPQQQQQKKAPQKKKPRSTLKNITNTADGVKAAPKAKSPAHKINQILGIPPGGVRPPPPYNIPQMNLPFQQQPPPPVVPSYWGHDPSDTVPPDLCLLGCVFYITDYQKLVGDAKIAEWKQVIEQYGGQVDSAYSNRATHVLCANQNSDLFQLALRDQRRVVTAFWLNDVLVKKKMVPPWQALHLPSIYGEEKIHSNQIIALTNFEDAERDRVKQMIHAIGAKYTGYLTHSNSVLICKKPEGKKYEKAKEWKIPVVNVNWLSDLLLGHTEVLALPVKQCYKQVGQGDEFQMDYSKAPHLMAPWRTALKLKESWKKFVPSHMNRGPSHLPHGQENHHPGQPPTKKQRYGNTPPVSAELQLPEPRVLFTGFPRGITKKMQMVVSQLGGSVVENAAACTHLVAQCLSRTMKFFVAINVCKHILNKQWLEDSLQRNVFVEETPYILQDPQAESEMGCSLLQTLSRARSKQLFRGLTFYVTPSVTPPPADLTAVIESAGGTVVKKKRASPKTIATACKDEQGNPTYFVITCADDIHLSADLIAKNIAIYNAEFILTGVMRQQIDYNNFRIEVQF